MITLRSSSRIIHFLLVLGISGVAGGCNGQAGSSDARPAPLDLKGEVRPSKSAPPKR